MAVYPQGGVSLFLAPQTFTGTFCCGVEYDTQQQWCPNETQGSHVPFDLPSGQVQFDRVHGDTYYAPAFGLAYSSSSSGTVPTSTVTVTSTPSPKTSTSSKSAEAAIGAGVGVPLLVALLVACVLLWYQWRQRRKLERQLRDMKTTIFHTDSEMRLSAAPPAMQNAQMVFSNGYQPAHREPPELSHESGVFEAGGRDPQELDVRRGHH